MTISATSTAYKQLNTDLGINPSSGLDKFIYYTNLQTSDGGNLLYNINKAIVHP
jgi:hypothetical protein